jgi:hypothetical protein
MRAPSTPPFRRSGAAILAASLALAVAAGCSRAAPADKARFGALMGEAGRRFELFGRAVQAERFELAGYELGELEEIFEDDLPLAAPPKETGKADLASLSAGFLHAELPALRSALASHDRAVVAAAFARAAGGCNPRHAASGHGFIEIPTEAGAGVPRLDAPAAKAAAGAALPVATPSSRP